MHVLRDKKLWKAVGLAVGLFAFAFAGIHLPHAQPEWTVWNEQIWPRLSPLLPATGVVLVALVTASLLRPRRPQRMAAVIGGLGEVIALVLPHQIMRVMSWEGTHVPSGFQLRVLSYDLVFAALFAPILMVACWIGADYWVKGSWSRFWRGPGGAIIKGGLVAGAVSIITTMATAIWVLPHALAAVKPPPGVVMPRESLGSHFISSLNAIAGAATITALFARWRPSPWIGAFAASGLALVPTSIVIIASPEAMLAPIRNNPAMVAMMIASLGGGVLTAALAGSFAGRWEPEPLRDE